VLARGGRERGKKNAAGKPLRASREAGGRKAVRGGEHRGKGMRGRDEG